MAPFDDMFTAPTWQRVLVLLIGAVLSPGRRTMAAALRGTGLDQDPHFLNDHRVLRRSRWPSRRVAQCLFSSLVNLRPKRARHNRPGRHAERRWDAKIAARGVYRDPAWSSHGRFLVTDMNAGERRNAQGFAYTNANAADSKRELTASFTQCEAGPLWQKTHNPYPSLIRLWNETNVVRVDNGIDSSLIRRDLAVEDEHREAVNKRPRTKRE
jgi:hypothetical protein